MKKVILITGISSGFGKKTAELLASKGHIVYGTVRSNNEVDPGINVLRMDLTDVHSIRSAVAQVIQNEGRIDILINNAGMHLGGPIEEAPVEWFTRQMETNVTGLVHMLQATLPQLRKQGQGTIINFSSIGGLMGLPFQPFYSASKFAIEGLSEALRMELKPFNIKVIVINPGDFHTSNTANRTNITVEGGPYDAQFKKSLDQIEKDENEGWDPMIMAHQMLKIVESKNPRNRYIVASFEQKLAVILKKLLPIQLFSHILGSHYQIK
ncbi:MAG: SDR family oxidoreductase [Bacteroidales bacterium]|nr:SDR family oxidoreductase [Bacteroidales bacterium]